MSGVTSRRPKNCAVTSLSTVERAALTLATGSAGTQTGLTAGVAMFDLPLDVVAYAVCDDADWFNRRVVHDWQASVARWPQLPK